MDFFILILELIGAAAFAVSGAMTGIRKNMDIFGACVLGLTVAVGGGSTRLQRFSPASSSSSREFVIFWRETPF